MGAGPPGRARCGPRSGTTSARASSRCCDTGVATWDEDLLLFLERSGYPEETYHTFSYSPLDGDDGRTAGMLCVVTENTERVRRRAPDGDPARPRGRGGRDPHRAATCWRAVADRARPQPADLPFSLDLPASTTTAARRLAALRPGSTPGAPAAPLAIAPDRRRRGLAGRRDCGAGETELVDDLAERFADAAHRRLAAARRRGRRRPAGRRRRRSTGRGRLPRRRAQPVPRLRRRLPRLRRAGGRPDRLRRWSTPAATRPSGSGPRRWPSSTAPRPTSSPTSATSSGRR